MKAIHCDKKRVDAAILRQELLAASVPLGPETFPLGDTYTTPTSLAVLVAVDTDPTPELIATVQGVVTSHTPPPEPTPAQIKRQQVRRLIESDDSPESIRLRAIIRVLYGSLVEVRKRQQEDRTELKRLAKQLIEAGLPIQPITLKIDSKLNRSWAEAQQAVLDLANSEIQE